MEIGADVARERKEERDIEDHPHAYHTFEQTDGAAGERIPKTQHR